MYKKNSKFKGSGILVVILSAMAFSIYTISTFSESEHFGILIDKYEKNNKEYYERYINKEEEFYQKILIKNNEKSKID